MSQPSPEPAVTVGVLKETTPGEQRVAVVPESVPPDFLSAASNTLVTAAIAGP